MGDVKMVQSHLIDKVARVHNLVNARTVTKHVPLSTWIYAIVIADYMIKEAARCSIHKLNSLRKQD